MTDIESLNKEFETVKQSNCEFFCSHCGQNHKEFETKCNACENETVITKTEYLKQLKTIIDKSNENEKLINPSKDQLEILQTDLFHRITKEEFPKKVVGEERNMSAIFLSACSKFLDGISFRNNILVNSKSSAGKDHTCKSCLEIFPREMVVARSKITPEVLTYWHNRNTDPDWTWNGKTFYLADVRQEILNCPALKLFCTEENKTTVLIKQKVIEIEIEGKPFVLLTMAEGTLNAEILNRLNLITLDETAYQNERILTCQANYAEGNRTEEYNYSIINALRYLKQVNVLIPYASRITKYLPTNSVRIRRDFPRLLNLIKASAALHQYNRERTNKGQLIADKQDYENARYCLNAIRTGLYLDLTYNLRKAYEKTIEYTQNNNIELRRFSAKEIYAAYPAYSERQWYRNLNELASKGALDVHLEEKEWSKKKVVTYCPIINTSGEFKLPEFGEL